ncbi:protein takeout-like [Lycorma delicatula]|uniref:protein takeout-like n=1 Tax=Lycorma delicatula TaxID=130591 RepID=UPI003F50F496
MDPFPGTERARFIFWFNDLQAVTVVQPEYIISCRKADPQINACIRRTFDHLRPYLIAGIPEIKLQSIEPMVIQKMTMENGHGPVRVRAVFSNMTIYGASNYTVLSVKSDLSKLRMDLGLGIPRIEATGSYDVNGNVLLFPVRSKGDFWASFSNITGIGKIYGIEVKKNGVVFMKTERLGIDFKLGKSRFKIRDVLNNNNVLGEAMSQFLNQNANEIIEEMKPAAAQAISRHFKSFLNGAFLQIPLQVWLRDAV